MVKITEKDEVTLDDRCASMFEIAEELFRDVKHEWAESHPQNVQKKYDLQMETPNHPSGRAFRPSVGFSLWAVEPYNFGRTREKLTRVIDVYPTQSKVSVNNPKYFGDALKLAETYETKMGQEFTLRKDY